MNEYVILYSVKRWKITWSSNNSHVSIRSGSHPPLDDAYSAVKKGRHAIHETMQGVTITGMVEMRPNEPYKIPSSRIWPFTLPLFDRTFTKEDEQKQTWIYQEHL